MLPRTQKNEQEKRERQQHKIIAKDERGDSAEHSGDAKEDRNP